MNTTGRLSVESPSLQVAEFDEGHFPRPWSYGQWSELDPDHHFLLTWRNQFESLVAFALFGFAPGDKTAHLYKVLIHPESRGSDVSREFWSSITRELFNKGFDSIYLEVEASNKRAIRFYQKNGFQILRINKCYYSNGEDALIMICSFEA